MNENHNEFSFEWRETVPNFWAEVCNSRTWTSNALTWKKGNFFSRFKCISDLFFFSFMQYAKLACSYFKGSKLFPTKLRMKLNVFSFAFYSATLCFCFWRWRTSFMWFYYMYYIQHKSPMHNFQDIKRCWQLVD